MLEKAILIAINAHKGQVDKAGKPYILHPLRLMFSRDNETEKICAVLHDVIEDTDVTLDYLKGEGFSEEVVSTLDDLTRRKNESYDEFINRIIKNKISCYVKLADLCDNMDLSRIENPSRDDYDRVKKYKKASDKIVDALEENPLVDLIIPIKQLVEGRKLFHSEADFQFALSWEIQKVYPQAKVRLEYCPAEINPNMHIDVLVMIGENWFPIELKYKTLKISYEADQELYQLKEHGAQDLGRYDYLLDVERIEYLSRTLPKFKKGYAIFLTNDPSYWRETTGTNTVYDDFKISEGIEKHGKMEWVGHASAGTKRGREKSIELDNRYKMNWHDYSKLSEGRNGEFRYLISTVTNL